VVKGRDQLRRVAVAAGTTHRLAVHRDHPPARHVPDPGGHPRRHRPVQPFGIHHGQRPADRRLRRQHHMRVNPMTRQGDPVLVRGPLTDRHQRAGTGQHSTLRQRQHRRHRVPDPPRFRIGHLRKHLDQRPPGQPDSIGSNRRRWHGGVGLPGQACVRTPIVTAGPTPPQQRHTPHQSHKKPKVTAVPHGFADPLVETRWYLPTLRSSSPLGHG
jgi:hypothetical protein